MSYGQVARVLGAGYDARAIERAGWVRHAIPVRDFHAPSLAQLERFVALVRAAGPCTKVLVHCQGGSGRTGTMAAAYWIAHAPRSLYPLLNGGDAAILYCFVFLYLVFAGGGAFALDNRRR